MDNQQLLSALEDLDLEAVIELYISAKAGVYVNIDVLPIESYLAINELEKGIDEYLSGAGGSSLDDEPA